MNNRKLNMLQHFVTEMTKGSGGFCLVHGGTRGTCMHCCDMAARRYGTPHQDKSNLLN